MLGWRTFSPCLMALRVLLAFLLAPGMGAQGLPTPAARRDGSLALRVFRPWMETALGTPFGVRSAMPLKASSPGVARNDFNGDGTSDLVWRHLAQGQVYLMPLSAGHPLGGGVAWTEPDGAWSILEGGDLDGDGRGDLVWWNRHTGMAYGMLLDGVAVKGGGVLHTEADTAWTIQALADFDGNGTPDLLWRNGTSGMVYLMPLQGLAQGAGAVVWQEPDPAWGILGARDFNGDGKADILWRNEGTGMLYLHFMEGMTVRAGQVLYTESDLQWRPVALLDFTGDGTCDLMWRNLGTGMVYAMPILGGTPQGGAVLHVEPDAQWQARAVGDLDGDGREDLVWWHAGTGQVYGMLLNGPALKAWVSVWTEPDTNWQIQAGGVVKPSGLGPVISRFTATPTGITAGQCSTLAWTVAGATGLSLEPGLGPVTGTSRTVTPTASTTYTLTATSPGGTTAAKVTVTVSPDTLPPSAPTGLAAAQVTANTLTLSWVASTDDVGVALYRVYQGSTPVGEATGTLFGVTGLAAGTAYSFTVVALDAAGNPSEPSATLNLTTPLPAIASFIATPPALTVGMGTTLSWVVSNATSLSLSQGIGAVTGSSFTVSPTVTTTYVLTATNGTRSVTRSVLVTVGSTTGRILYVDGTHPQANDANPGTEALPWKTIQAGAHQAVAGDQIRVKPGTYDERVLVRRGGTPGAKVVFTSWPRREARVLHGFSIKADGVAVRGFDLTHDVGGWEGNGVWLAANQVVIEDNYIHDVPGHGLRPAWATGTPGLWSDIRVLGNHIYRCNMGLIVAGKRWRVEGNEIERLVRPATGGGDADNIRFFGEDHVLSRNFMHGTRKEEVGASHTDLFQTYVVNAGEYARNVLIEGNLGMGYFNQGLMMDQSRSALGEMAGITVRGNVFIGATSWNICAFGVQNLEVTHNTFVNHALHGVGFRDQVALLPAYGATGVVKHNIFAFGGGSYAKEALSVQDAGFNLTYNLRTPGTPAATDLVERDPLFVSLSDPLGPDGRPFTADDGLRLRVGSPALGAGEGGVDLGAYAGGTVAKPSLESFTATPTSLERGQSSVLAWSVQGATTLGLEPGFGTVTGTSHTVAPLETTTYTLTATNEVGTSTRQVTVSVTTDATPPSVPTGLWARSLTATGLWLEWQASTDSLGVTAYRVTRNGNVVGEPPSPGFSDSSLKHQYIRDFVGQDRSRVLFDYADILTHNQAGQKYLTTWNDGGTPRSHANIHPDNMANEVAGTHIGQEGCLRLAKAMWWLLARMAGWDGSSN